MLILVGESASGKSSVEKYLVKHYGYNKIVTYTTREPRQDEIDGIDYHFITKEKFEHLKSRGFFAEYAEYNGWNYGTAIDDIADDTIAVLTPHGLRQIMKLKNTIKKFKNKELDIISFYINVPRRDRLIKILERGDNIEEAYRRNLSDVGMFDGIKDEVNYAIDNKRYAISVEYLALDIHRAYQSSLNEIKEARDIFGGLD